MADANEKDIRGKTDVHEHSFIVLHVNANKKNYQSDGRNTFFVGLRGFVQPKANNIPRLTCVPEHAFQNMS